MNDRSITRPQFRHLLLLLALAVAPACADSPAQTPAAGVPTFAPDTSAVEADENLQWTIPFQVQNRFPVGVYFDSLICTVQDLDPGETRLERVTVLDVSHIVRETAVSAGDLYAFTYVAPAIAEHARLTFRLVMHRADKTSTSVTTSVEMLPGRVSRAHPSEFLTVAGKRVEYVLFPVASDSVPALMLVHGYGANARTFLRHALRIAPRGYTVMLVSMPGYGQSDGPPDFDGPATLKALGAALDRLKAERGVDPNRVGAWGISRGAGSVALLAEKRADLRAAIAESGTYDLWAAYRAGAPARRQAIVREAGSDSAAWRERSAALNPGKPGALLILHGEKDELAPASQAHGFAGALKARGAGVEERFFPNAGHSLPLGDVMRTWREVRERRRAR